MGHRDQGAGEDVNGQEERPRKEALEVAAAPGRSPLRFVGDEGRWPVSLVLYTPGFCSSLAQVDYTLFVSFKTCCLNISTQTYVLDLCVGCAWHARTDQLQAFPTVRLLGLFVFCKVRRSWLSLPQRSALLSACGQVEGRALALIAMVMASWGWHAPSGRWRYPGTSPGVDFELRETSAEPEARLIDDLEATRA